MVLGQGMPCDMLPDQYRHVPDKVWDIGPAGGFGVIAERDWTRAAPQVQGTATEGE